MKAVVERIVPVGGAVTVAVDDTLFHRYGRKVHGARYQHDGSAKGRDGIGRGNCFVIVGIVVAVPFLARQVCLPVLFRLHIPKASASRPSRPERWSTCSPRHCPGAPCTWWATACTGARPGAACPPASPSPLAWLPARALYGPELLRTGRRGHPAWKGGRLGTAAEMAATAAWRRTTVTRYGVTEAVDLAVITCLWWGSLHRTPVRVVLGGPSWMCDETRGSHGRAGQHRRCRGVRRAGGCPGQGGPGPGAGAAAQRGDRVGVRDRAVAGNAGELLGDRRSGRS